MTTTNNLPRFQTILYPTDLGKHTRPVFRHALSLAQLHDAQIIMLHAIKPLGATSRAMLGAYMPDLDVNQIEHEGMEAVIATMEKRLAEFCADEREACNEGGERVREIVVRAGMPSEVILHTAIARKADVIVMGSCTHSVLGNHSLGATVRKVTLHAVVPTLIVPNAQV